MRIGSISPPLFGFRPKASCSGEDQSHWNSLTEFGLRALQTYGEIYVLRPVTEPLGTVSLDATDHLVLRALGEQQRIRQKNWDDKNFVCKGARYYREHSNLSQLVVSAEALTKALLWHQVTEKQGKISLEKLNRAGLIYCYESNLENLAGHPTMLFYRLPKRVHILPDGN